MRFLSVYFQQMATVAVLKTIEIRAQTSLKTVPYLDWKMSRFGYLLRNPFCVKIEQLYPYRVDKRFEQIKTEA